MMRASAPVVLLGLLACEPDNTLTAIPLDAIAVVNGDFDDIGSTLIRNEIGSVAFNGYVEQSTTFVGDPDDVPPHRDDPGHTVEELFTAPAGDQQKWTIELYNAVFINSGTRGLNAFEYNHSLEPDDQLLKDPLAMDNVCSFPKKGSLFVTDWAYNLVEACWPDAIEFANDDATIDDAQVGVIGEVLADVSDEELATALDSSVANVQFNYSAFAVMEDVGADVEVLLRGDVTVQPKDGGDVVVQKNVPLIVRIPPSTYGLGANGQVVFSSFHLYPQTPVLSDALLFRGIDGLEVGAGEKSSEAIQ